MLVTRTQNVYLEEILRCMRGWAIPLVDKTLNNDLVDVEAINVPIYIKNYKDPGTDKNRNWNPVQPCSSYVYSDFVGPGHH